MSHVLFEEDGAFKSGTVLARSDASCQVELASGKRSKVKSANILLQFEHPAPAQLLLEAQRAAEGIDLDFLWECAPREEFGFGDLARDYQGHEPSAVEAASILLRLHGAPVYFHRKGRGRFRAAPPEILKAALAAVERKQQQELRKQAYVEALATGSVPTEIARQAIDLLLSPDRNSVEYKALEQAADAAHCSPLRLLLKLGAISSPYRWHVDSFNATAFPRGTGFAEGLGVAVPSEELPLAPVRIVSIDDSSTTEIDDGFSLQRIDGVVRIGIHIAAPAVALQRGDALDTVARARMSTVYAPGLKYTMLPTSVIDAFSLNEGRIVPVVSLYVDVDPDSLEIRGSRTCVERAGVAANLRHDELDELVTEERIRAGVPDLPHAELLTFLWHFACKLRQGREQVRGKPEPQNRLDYNFVVEGEGAGEQAQVQIVPRKRGAPLDLIVSELMILANSTWGAWLAAEGRVGIYRSQSMGRVKMSTRPGPHEGMGVSHYTWCTSPLRRYVDLVNQRQLVTAARAAPAVYAQNDAEIFAVVSAFDAAYSNYADFQYRMERYWCLRWLRQQDVKRIAATVLKEEVIRLDGLPYVTRMPGLPPLARGRRVEVDILDMDEIDTTLQLRLHRVLEDEVAELSEEEQETTGADIEDAEVPAIAAPSV